MAEQRNNKIELANAFFDYCVFSVDKENSMERSYFSSQSLYLREFIQRFDKPLPPEKYMVLLTAFTQQGKTFTIAALIGLHQILGQNSLLLVKSIPVAEQTIPRIRKFFDNAVDFLKHRKIRSFSDDDLSVLKNPFCYLDSSKTKAEKQIFTRDLRLAITNKRCSVIIAIHNQGHLNRIRKLYDETGRRSKIVLFIDEAHELGGYKVMGASPLGNDLHDPECKYDTEIAIFKEAEMTHRVYLITATPQCVYFMEPRLRGHSVCRIPQPKGYVGIPNMHFVISEKEKLVHGRTQEGKIVSLYSGWLTILANLSETEPIKRFNKFLEPDSHPIVLLSMIERENEKQRMILEACKLGTVPINDDHRKIIEAKWVIICVNQNGIHVSHETFKGQTITFQGQTVHDFLNTGELLFEKTTIEKVLQWLFILGCEGCEDNREGRGRCIARFPRIMIIAYNKAKASTTFGSAVTEDPYTDANWHITHIESINTGKTLSADKAEQNIGRGTGVYRDVLCNNRRFQTTVYCDRKTKEKLIRGFTMSNYLTELIRERATHGDFNVMEFVRSVEMYPSHIPHNPFSVNGLKSMIKRKKGKNPKEDIEKHAMKNAQNAGTVVAMLQPSLQGLFMWRSEGMKLLQEKYSAQIRVIKETESKKEDHNLWSNVKTAYERKTGKIYKIIKAFDDADFTSLSTEQLSVACDGSFQYDNYDHWDKAHSKYFILTRAPSGNFNLRAKVIEILGLRD